MEKEWKNMFAHNRDDHAKNFTFLYDEKKDHWGLAPAYDLTYSNTYYGEHTTSVNGNGIDPGKEELLAVARVSGMNERRCAKIADEIYEIVTEELKNYL